MPTRSPDARSQHTALAVTGALTTLGLLAASTLASAEGPLLDDRPYAVTEERVPCERYEPHRRPLFGDLHVHTARSQDASTQGTRVTPREAYQFARGEALGIHPHAEDGRPLRTVQLARPLDFTAITDHSEQLGEVHICNTPSSDGYGSLACRLYRNFPRVAFFVFNGRYSLLGSRWGFCGPGPSATV